MTEPKKIPSVQQNSDFVSSVKSGEQTVSCSPAPNNHQHNNHHHPHPLHTTTATAHHDLNFNNGHRRSPPESNYTSPDQPDPDPERGSVFEPDPDCSETKPLIPAAVSSVNEKTEENDDDDDDKKKKKEAEFSFRTLSSTKKWTFVAMAFANFAACTAFSLLAPFFPREAKMKGASQTIIGLIFSTFELWIFVSSPIFGNYLTKIGSRFLFLAGLFTCGVCAILFGTLDKGPGGMTFIVMCFVVRSVEALGASAFITASFAIIANEFPAHVSTVFGTLETFSGLGLMVGPPIGGFLYQLGGYGPPFYVMGGLLILCAVLVMLLLPIQQDIRQPDRGSILSLLTSPLVLVTILTISSGSFALGFLDPTLASHLEQFDLNSGMVGLVFVVGSAAYAFTAPVWGYLSDTKGISFPLVMAGNFVALVSYMIMGPSPLLPFLSHQLWLVIVALALVGLGVGCALVCTLKCLLIGAREIGFKDNIDTFGLISGLFNSAFSFGTFLGPTVGSVVMDYYGFDWASTITAGCFALSLLVFGMYLAVVKKCRNCWVVTMPEVVGSESGVSVSPRQRLLSTGSISDGGGRERASSPSSPRQRLLSTESTVGAHVGASYNSMGSTAIVIMDNNVDSGNGDAQRV